MEDGVARVHVGASQTLVFRERDDVADYDGHHIAIYIANFSGPHRRLKELHLLTREINEHEYRFKDVIDLETGKLLFITTYALE